MHIRHNEMVKRGTRNNTILQKFVRIPCWFLIHMSQKIPFLDGASDTMRQKQENRKTNKNLLVLYEATYWKYWTSQYSTYNRRHVVPRLAGLFVRQTYCYCVVGALNKTTMLIKTIYYRNCTKLAWSQWRNRPIKSFVWYEAVWPFTSV